MRNKYVRCMMPMNIQFFADPGEGGGSAGGTGGTGEGGEETNGGQQSFDDFLRGDGNQEEFNRRVQAAVNTAVTEAKQKWKLMTDDKVSEAEKLAKMTEEEKTEYLRQKKDKELTEREANLTRRELMAEAKNTLAEKKLPAGLSELLDYTNADSCKKSIDTMEKVFNEAVQAAVEQRMKGGNPPHNANFEDNQKDTVEKQVYNIMSGR